MLSASVQKCELTPQVLVPGQHVCMSVRSLVKIRRIRLLVRTASELRSFGCRTLSTARLLVRWTSHRRLARDFLVDQKFAAAFVSRAEGL